MTPSNSAHGPGHDAIGRSGAGALRARIESIVRRTIGAPGGSDDLVDLSVIALPGGWLRIAGEIVAAHGGRLLARRAMRS